MLAGAYMLAGVVPAFAGMHITEDFGGRLDRYAARYDRAAARNEKIEIDGECASACTMVFGRVPRENVCITSRAVFGFHYAWKDRGFDRHGEPIFGGYSASGTRAMTEGYPPVVNAWISARGGLALRLKRMPGSALHGYFRKCGHEGGR